MVWIHIHTHSKVVPDLVSMMENTDKAMKLSKSDGTSFINQVLAFVYLYT